MHTRSTTVPSRWKAESGLKFKGMELGRGSLAMGLLSNSLSSTTVHRIRNAYWEPGVQYNGIAMHPRTEVSSLSAYRTVRSHGVGQGKMTHLG